MESARSVTAALQKKSLSELLERVGSSYSTATVPRANFRAALQRQAVALYLSQINDPSEEMDDPVMLLLEKAHSLQQSEST